MSKHRLIITVPKISTATSIFLKGRFSFQARRELNSIFQNLLNHSAVNSIAINLSEVEYMDSSALGMLLELRNQAIDANRRLILSSPSDVAMQIFDVACFAKIFTIERFSASEI